jgi:hypothetical protein
MSDYVTCGRCNKQVLSRDGESWHVSVHEPRTALVQVRIA